MDQTEKITDIVFEAVREFNQVLPADRRLHPACETALFGGPENLDSLELLRLMALVEKKIKNDFGFSVNLFGPDAMGPRHPFATIQTLTRYLANQIDPKKAAGSGKA